MSHVIFVVLTLLTISSQMSAATSLCALDSEIILILQTKIKFNKKSLRLQMQMVFNAEQGIMRCVVTNTQNWVSQKPLHVIGFSKENIQGLLTHPVLLNSHSNQPEQIKQYKALVCSWRPQWSQACHQSSDGCTSSSRWAHTNNSQCLGWTDPWNQNDSDPTLEKYMNKNADTFFFTFI